MYYKIIVNNEIIDVVFNPIFLGCQKSNGQLVRCLKEQAEGILSSDGSTAWHVEGWARSPSLSLPSAIVVEITSQEYEQLKEILDNGKKANEVESKEIVQPSIEKLTLSALLNYKINLLREECANTIIKGIDIELGGVSKHFDLTIEDQINLIALTNSVDSGVSSVLFHAKDEPCQEYTAQEIKTVAFEANKHRVYHTTYFNNLKQFITLLDYNALSQVYYGMEIPEEYQTEAFKSLRK